MAPSSLSPLWLLPELQIYESFIRASPLFFYPYIFSFQNSRHSINMYQMDGKAALFTGYLVLNVPENPKGNSLFSPQFCSFLLFPSLLLHFSFSLCVSEWYYRHFSFIFCSLPFHSIIQVLKILPFPNCGICPLFAILSAISPVQMMTVLLLKYHHSYLIYLPAYILAPS